MELISYNSRTATSDSVCLGPNATQNTLTEADNQSSCEDMPIFFRNSLQNNSETEKVTHMTGKAPLLIANKELTIFHENVDRLYNKIDILTYLLNSITPDVLIITEYGLSKVNIELTNIELYINRKLQL